MSTKVRAAIEKNDGSMACGVGGVLAWLRRIHKDFCGQNPALDVSTKQPKWKQVKQLVEALQKAVPKGHMGWKLMMWREPRGVSPKRSGYLRFLRERGVGKMDKWKPQDRQRQLRDIQRADGPQVAVPRPARRIGFREQLDLNRRAARAENPRMVMPPLQPPLAIGDGPQVIAGIFGGGAAGAVGGPPANENPYVGALQREFAQQQLMQEWDRREQEARLVEMEHDLYDEENV